MKPSILVSFLALAASSALGAILTNDSSAVSLDLSRYVNSSLTQSILYHSDQSANHLQELPAGKQSLSNTVFDVSGIIQLDGAELHMLGKNFPKRIDGIQVGQSAQKIHLLHGTGWTDHSGRQLARLVLHFVDGSSQDFPIVYGVHVRDWWQFKEEPVKDPNSSVVWRGTNPQASTAKATLRLYRTTFDNPKPGVQIQSIDYVSAGSLSCPFMVALTLEK